MFGKAICGIIVNHCNACCQGPIGIPGVPGTAGVPGRDGISIKGDKGDPGEPAHERKSAFMAIKISYQTGNIGEVITFDKILTNVNNHFNPSTNLFTCHIPGTYVFMFSVGSYKDVAVHVHLVKNGHHIVSAHSRSNYDDNYDDNYDQNTNGAVLNLQVGDQIWLSFHSINNQQVASSKANTCTTLSGYLLYEN